VVELPFPTMGKVRVASGRQLREMVRGLRPARTPLEYVILGFLHGRIMVLEGKTFSDLGAGEGLGK
jgi:hypothetical protein